MVKQQLTSSATPKSQEPELGSWLRGLHFSGFSLIMIALLAVGVAVITPSFSVYLEQRQQVAALKANVQERTTERDRALFQRSQWQDPAYVRAEARNRLFYVQPGEIPFLVIEDVEIPEVAPKRAPNGIREVTVDWAQSLVSSVLVTGLAPVPSPRATDPATPAPAEPVPAEPVPAEPAPAEPAPAEPAPADPAPAEPAPAPAG